MTITTKLDIGQDVPVKPEPVRVPLEMSDIPRDAWFRVGEGHPEFPQSGRTDEGVGIGANFFNCYTMMKRGFEIFRPGSQVWKPCSKESVAPSPSTSECEP